MSQEKPNPSIPDWEKLIWQEAPYPGVYVSLVHEEPDPENPRVPLSTLMAVRVDQGCSIPLHRHNREPSWREVLTFPESSYFEIYRIDGLEQVLNTAPLTLAIETGEAFGLKNLNLRPLFFSSEMKPGFSGYEEIEEIK